MSRSIDKKVVEMKFDNEQFEKAVAQSRQSIKLMEKDINLLEGVKALKNLDKAVSSVDFSHMSKSIDGIKNSFGVLGTIGRSVINKLTTDAMTKFQQMARKVSSSIDGVFDKVYEKGYNRARNLENASFKIQGVLDRDETLTDENQKLEIRTRLTKMISESVTDTAFGLDEASVAASTLTTTFGTTEEGLEKIQKTLNAISGVAGTTGAAYQQIADIFTDASGKGVAQANEFNRLSLQGVNAEQEIANYINHNIKLRQKYNKILKENTKHTITAADVRELASKREISADLFAEAFQGYTATAKKANETLDGIKSNIGAAFGRLGALFIQPLIANSGPIVKFLQAVKDGISKIAEVLKNLGIPTAITNFLSNGITVAADHLNKLVDAFDKGTTPLNNFLEKLSKIFNTLGEIFNLDPENPYLGLGGEKLRESMAIDKLKDYFKEASDELGKNYKSYKQIEKETLKTFSSAKGIDKNQQKKIAMATYLGQMNDENVHSLDQYKALTKEWYRQTLLQHHSKKEVDKIMKEDMTKKVIDELAIQKYNEATAEQTKSIRELVDAEVELEAEEKEIFSHDYIGDIFSGAANIIGTVIDAINVFTEAIFGTSTPLKNFEKALNGDPKEARKGLNSLTEGFKNATQKIRDFVNTEGFKNFITTLGKIIGIAVKIIGGLVKVASHVFGAIAPIITKISDLLGKIFKPSSEAEEGVSVWDHIINTLCSAIDFLGGVLLKIWDIGEGVVNWLIDNGVIGAIGAIGEKIIEFAKLAISNWPEAWAKIKEAMGGFSSKAKEVFGWVGEKLGPVFEKLEPYLTGFKDKVSEATNGFIDLEKPIDFIKSLFGGTSDEATKASSAIDKVNTALDKVNTTADKVGGALTNAKTGFSSFSGIGGKGQIGMKMDLVSMANNIPTDDASGLVNGLKNFDISKEDAEKAEEKAGVLETILLFLKNFLTNIPWASVVAAIAAGAAAMGISKVGTGIKRIGEGVKLFSKNMPDTVANITGFDTKTERLKATGEVLKRLAIVLGVFIVGVLAVTGAVYLLGKMDPTQMIRGMIAAVIIMGVMGVFIGLVAHMAKSLTGGTTTGANYASSQGFSILGKFGFGGRTSGASTITEDAFKPLIGLAAVLGVFVVGVLMITGAIAILGHMKIDTLLQGGIAFAIIGGILIGLTALVLGMIKSIMHPKGGQPLDAKQSKALSSSLFGIAAILFVFTNAVTKIAVAIRLLSFIPMGGHFLEAIGSFALISGILLGIVGMTFAFIRKMLSDKNKDMATPAKLEQIPKIMAMVALIVFVIGQAAGSIMRNMVAVAAGSLTGGMGAAIGAAATVMGLMLFIVGVVLYFASDMAKNVASKKGTGPETIKKLTLVLAACALIIFVIGQAVGSILRNVALVAAALSIAKPSAAEAALGMAVAALVVIFAVVAVVLGAAAYMGKNLNRQQMKQVTTLLAMVAVIIGVMALAIAAIGYAASQMVGVDAEAISAMTGAIIAIGAFIAVMAIIMVIVGKINPNTGPMVAIIALVLVVGLLFLAIGKAVSQITANPITQEAISMMGICLIAVGVIVAISAIVGALAGKQPMVAAGILVMALLIAAISLLFSAIGKMALNIGKGVNLIAKGIERLVKLFKRLGKEPSKDLKAGAKTLGEAMGQMLLGLVDSFIEFGKGVEARREDVKAAIKSIFGIINDAIGTSVQEAFLLFLNRLSDMLVALDIWLKENSDTLTSVLIQVGDIIYDVLMHFFARLREDFPGWLENVVSNIENKSEELSDKLVRVGIAIIRGLITGIANHEDEIVECIWNLIKELVNIIFKFFGFEAPFEITWTAKPAFKEDGNSGKSNLEEAGGEIPQQLMDGTEKNNQKITNYFEHFIENLCHGIWKALLNSSWLQKAADFLVDWADGLGNYVYDHTLGLMDKYNDAVRTKEELEHAAEQIDKFMIGEGHNGEYFRKHYQDLVQEYTKGGMAMAEAQKKAAQETDKWSKEQIEYIKKNYGIKSPSKVMDEIGQNINAGFARGLNKTKAVFKAVDDEKDYISDSFDSLNTVVTPKFSSESAFDTLKKDFTNALPKIKKIIDDSGLFDSDAFTIKPNVDLTNVENAKDTAQGIFDNMGLGINVDSAVDMFGQLKSGNFSSIDVSKLASGFDSANSNTSNDFSSGNQNTNITFNQNNFSPESLSSIDIYRQTESLLGSNSTVNGIMNAIGVKSSDVKFSF